MGSRYRKHVTSEEDVYLFLPKKVEVAITRDLMRRWDKITTVNHVKATCYHDNAVTVVTEFM